jgi:predicted permease
VAYHEIAPRFFETLKIPLPQGRDFDDRDRPGSPRVAIINETLAQKMWPDSSSLERTLLIENKEFQVVGVFGDAQLRTALEGPLPFLYVPYWQDNFDRNIDSRMVIRVAGDPGAMLPQLRREVAAVDPNVPVGEVMTMTQQVQGEYLPVLLASRVLVCSGVIALFLSVIGLYSALAFAVAQRTREIGIRMALGARRADVLQMTVRQGLKLVGAGMILGLGAAFLLTRVMTTLLYGISATDPTTFIGISVVLLVVAILASYVPALRATKVDPITALRAQ